jgi:hypothetical protein
MVGLVAGRVTPKKEPRSAAPNVIVVARGSAESLTIATEVLEQVQAPGVIFAIDRDSPPEVVALLESVRSGTVGGPDNDLLTALRAAMKRTGEARVVVMFSDAVITPESIRAIDYESAADNQVLRAQTRDRYGMPLKSVHLLAGTSRQLLDLDDIDRTAVSFTSSVIGPSPERDVDPLTIIEFLGEIVAQHQEIPEYTTQAVVDEIESRYRRSSLTLDYPVLGLPRYGHGRPSHEGMTAVLERGRQRYSNHIDQMIELGESLRGIPVDVLGDRTALSWRNDDFTGFDAAALYTLLATNRPRRFLEVGSGSSTLFARRASDDHKLDLQIISIDPNPRRGVDDACDVIIRHPLESVDLKVFGEITPDDVVFFNGSHYVHPNSDCEVFFFEVLPSLPPGVLVHVHDIFWPSDYPLAWENRLYSEQYVLGAMLLAAPERFTVEFPSYFVAHDPELAAKALMLFGEAPLRSVPPGCGSFWFRT